MGACTENGYELQIKDNGIGIPEEEVDKITEAFYMVDKSRARKEGGAGLGMALCRKIVSLHQAEWKIESRIGEGTQITVRFPDPQAGQH
jgi:signal transduction histidine kinase